jgi:hypothetical protein
MIGNHSRKNKIHIKKNPGKQCVFRDFALAIINILIISTLRFVQDFY